MPPFGRRGVVNLQQRCAESFAPRRRRLDAAAAAGGCFGGPKSRLARHSRERVRRQAAGQRGQKAGRDMLERIVQVSRAAAGLRQEDVYGIIRAAHAGERARRALRRADLPRRLVRAGARGRRRDRPSTPASPASPATRATAASSGASRERALCRLFPGQAMALRTRACLDPGLLEAFGWRPGLPGRGLPRRRAGRVRGAGLPAGRRRPAALPARSPDGLRAATWRRFSRPGAAR